MICLCATTRRAARLLTQRYEEALRPANLTPAQFEVLATLGQRQELSQGALADALALDQTTLSRNLKPLLTRGLLDRSTSARDRRQNIYRLTRAGTEALTQATPMWRSAHEEMKLRLGGGWHATLEVLKELNAAASFIG